MQRCTGPCGRLMLVTDFPRGGYGQCWDCHAHRQPEHLGYDLDKTRGRRPARGGRSWL